MESEDVEMTNSEPKADHPTAGTICAIDRKSVHRICSGQVVLTLATAVKELLENSIDAGATIVDIKLKDYGSELIEVSDNGMGVHENNFQALTLKHYTSKLQDFSDLINVETFGFRGEALSSLCALSDMTVTTKHRDAAVGTKLEFDHNGKITKQTNQARQVGTTVTLQNLFYTLPVRHKEFQRNTKKEFVKMVQVLNSYCIISTGVRISCTNQTGKGSRSTVVSSQGNVNMLENISNVFGPKQSQGLLEFKKIEPNEDQCSEFGIKGNNSSVFRIEGYVSKCEHGQGRSSTDRQFFFINGRPFDSAKLSKVVNEVYHQYNRHQYPFVVFKITVEKDNVDVNVTPDKRQVFLEGEKLIMATVKASLIAMYEPTTSVLQYQPVPVQSFGKIDQGENTRLVKHQSLEKQIGFSSLMKLKRSFSSAFSKEDSSSPVTASPTPSSHLMKQRRLDAFVSSYHSPSKLHKDTDLSNNHRKGPDNDVVIVNPSQELPSLRAVDGGKGQITDDKAALNDVSDQDHVELKQRKLAELENVIPDEKGDHLNVLSLTTTDSSSYELDNGNDLCRTEGQEPGLSEHDDASSSQIDANHSQKISQCLGNDTRSVHNEFPCVQKDSELKVTLHGKENCVLSNKFSVKNVCIENKSCFKNDICDEEEVCVEKNGTCIHPYKNLDEICRHLNKNQTDEQGIIQKEEHSDRLCFLLEETTPLSSKLKNSSNFELENLKTEENLDQTSLRNNVSVILHESQMERTKDPQQAGDCHIVQDTEEDVERKEISVRFSMQSLRNSWKSRRKDKTDGEISRAFRATINPTENQAAEQELQREIKKDMFAQMEILGQFNLGFIIAKLEKDLFIVDQHATDEKYNFETLQRDTVIQSQKLICPLNLELTSSNETILMDNLDIFRKNGFEFVINEEGQPTQRVKLSSTPVSKNWNFGKEDIEEMLFMLTDSPGVACRPSRVRAMFASRACRKSVMIGTTLNKAEMKKLVCHMGEIEQPWNCPHGRPTMRHLINLDMVPR